MIAKNTVEVDEHRARQNLAPRRDPRGSRRRPARHGQLRHPRGAVRRGRRLIRSRALPMIVLGIDPGTAALGYGIVEAKSGRAAHGRRAAASRRSRTPRCRQRLLAIHGLPRRAHRAARPDLIAVERLFFSRNAQTAFAVGQARGVVLLAAAQAEVPVREATPNEVKVAVTGYGTADKEQVGRMVAVCLGLTEAPRPDDTADALAIAIWAANTERAGARGRSLVRARSGRGRPDGRGRRAPATATSAPCARRSRRRRRPRGPEARIA